MIRNTNASRMKIVTDQKPVPYRRADAPSTRCWNQAQMRPVVTVAITPDTWKRSASR